MSINSDSQTAIDQLVMLLIELKKNGITSADLIKQYQLQQLELEARLKKTEWKLKYIIWPIIILQSLLIVCLLTVMVLKI